MIHNLKKHIENSIDDLYRVVGISCWNKVSRNAAFILSDINEFANDDFVIQSKLRNKVNDSKIPISLEEAVELLNKEYHDLYDVNLYVFKAFKNKTIIEIMYFRKSNFEPDYFEVIKNNQPMFHSKVSIPYYARDKEKFDVNWEYGGIRHLWKKLLCDIKYKINTMSSTGRKSG